MNPTRILELVIVISSVILGAYLYLDNIHAKQDEMVKEVFELREEIYDGQAKNYAEIADYYRRLEAERELEQPEIDRKEYAAKQAVEKQERVEKVQDVLDKLDIE